MDKALEEHHVMYGVIGELKKKKPGSQRYDAIFTVLGELCKHHNQTGRGRNAAQRRKSRYRLG